MHDIGKTALLNRYVNGVSLTPYDDYYKDGIEDSFRKTIIYAINSNYLYYQPRYLNLSSYLLNSIFFLLRKRSFHEIHINLNYMLNLDSCYRTELFYHLHLKPLAS